jgi:hypothetical protein
MQSNPPSASGSGSASPASRTQQRKRQAGANSILRNYYGLKADDRDPSASVEPVADPTDPDGASFDVTTAFDRLLRTQPLSRLLREESDLLTSIRELDGERQSLVYNHHHELVSASETMRKMKERADTLLPSLDSLQSSLQSITSTTESLSSIGKGVGQKTDSDEAHVTISIKTVVDLPRRLRDLIILGETSDKAVSESGLTKAQGLWGSMESVLAAWDEAGVGGAKDIMQSCRQILREASQENTATVD